MKNFLIILFLLITPIVSATDYYIKNSGSDSNTGRSDGQAWRTINKLNSTSFSPGDIIYFNKGDTWTESVTFTPLTSGTSGHPITFSSYGTGADPIIEFTASVTHGIALTGRSYLTFDGLVIDGSLTTIAISTGVVLRSNSTHNIFTNCSFQNWAGSGLYWGLACDYNTLSYSTIFNNGRLEVAGSPSHGMYITSSFNIIEYNAVYDHYHYGIHLYNGATYQCNDNIVRYNFCYNNSASGIILYGGSRNKCYYNISINSERLWGILVANAPYSEVYNNTVYGNPMPGIYIGTDSPNCIVKNNIVYNNGGTIDNRGGAILSNNLTTNPLFLNASGTYLLDTDFKISSSSPARDAGTNVSLTQDYFGNVIVDNPDIGANEYNSSSKWVLATGITVTGSGGATAITADNGTLQLSATVLPSDATNKTVKWSISNGTGQASVSSGGMVTAVANGTITARATANDGSGVYGTLIITISNQINVIPVSGITVTGAGGAATITTDNGTLQLSVAVSPSNATNKAVTWSISNGTGQASISIGGLVTAVANGTVTARATANDGSGVYGTLVITTLNQVNVFPVSGITVTGAGGAIIITTDNGTLQLSAAVSPANATNKAVTWSISNGTGQASVSTGGLVTAVANGTVTTRATANDGSGVYGTLVITISHQDIASPPPVAAVNTPPVVVIKSQPTYLSGFVGELDATESYDLNKDNLSFNWAAPGNIPVSATNSSKIEFLSPVVNTPQIVEFKLNISDGKTIQSKIVKVEILPYKPELEVAEVSNVEASGFQTPYLPYNILDGNIATMWSVNGDNQWIIMELKEAFDVQHIRMAFQLGQRKESYFDILGSEDKVTWEEILMKSSSCAFSGDLQVFEFPPSKAGKEFKYVKLVGHSNSVDSWNYISELKIFGYRYRKPSSYDEQPIKLYPNPAHEYVNIRIDDPNLKPDFIKIINLSGKIIFQDKIDPDIINSQISINLKQGLYIVQIGSNNLTLFAQKLMIIN